MPRDFLIEEVRERRRQVLAEYGDDLGRLVEAIQRAQRQEPERYVNLRKLKSARAPGTRDAANEARIDGPGGGGR
jgi:hypothetical protein